MNRVRKQLCIAAASLSLWGAVSATAATLPQSLAVPGGIAILPVADATDARPTVSFNDKEIAVVRGDDGWEAVVGLPLSTTPGDHRILVKPSKADAYHLTFRVDNRDYPEQRLIVKNKRHVNPDPDDLKRIRAERQRIGKAPRRGGAAAEFRLAAARASVQRVRSAPLFQRRAPQSPHRS